MDKVVHTEEQAEVVEGVLHGTIGKLSNSISKHLLDDVLSVSLEKPGSAQVQNFK